jgi:hypothetical protein
MAPARVRALEYFYYFHQYYSCCLYNEVIWHLVTNHTAGSEEEAQAPRVKPFHNCSDPYCNQQAHRPTNNKQNKTRSQVQDVYEIFD